MMSLGYVPTWWPSWLRCLSRDQIVASSNPLIPFEFFSHFFQFSKTFRAHSTFGLRVAKQRP